MRMRLKKIIAVCAVVGAMLIAGDSADARWGYRSYRPYYNSYRYTTPYYNTYRYTTPYYYQPYRYYTNYYRPVPYGYNYSYYYW